MDGQENIIDTLMSGAETGDNGNQSYTQDDENRARNMAADILRKQGMKQTVNEGQGYGKKIDEIDSKYTKTIDALKAEIESLKGTLQSTASTVDTHSNKLLTDNIVNEEINLSKDEVLAPYFNQQLVRNTFLANLRGDSQKGIAPKELTPYESLAIAKFYDLAKENAELKTKINRRQEMKDLSFDTVVSPYASVDRSSNVKDAKSAKQAALDYARELDGN